MATKPIAAILAMATQVIRHGKAVNDACTKGDLSNGGDWRDVDAWHRARDARDSYNAVTAPQIAETLISLWPVLEEWQSATSAVAVTGAAVRAVYAAAGHNPPDVDAYTAAVSAWTEAKARQTAASNALIAALDKLSAIEVAS